MLERWWCIPLLFAGTARNGDASARPTPLCTGPLQEPAATQQDGDKTTATPTDDEASKHDHHAIKRERHEDQEGQQKIEQRVSTYLQEHACALWRKPRLADAARPRTLSSTGIWGIVFLSATHSQILTDCFLPPSVLTRSVAPSPAIAARGRATRADSADAPRLGCVR